MKKIFVISLLISFNAFSSVCTEHASLLVTLKLKDMLSAYGGKYLYQKDELSPINRNPFIYKHICNKDEVEENLTYLKKEHYSSCHLKAVEESLDMSSGTLLEERVETILLEYIDETNCSPRITSKLEQNLIDAVRGIERELSKNKTNITEVCHMARRALSANYLLKDSCKN